MSEPFVLIRREGEPAVFELEPWLRRFPNLRAGISSRQGGVSEGGFTSLNCAMHVGDAERHVRDNRRRLAAAAGFRFAEWTCAEQVHGDRVHVVTRSEAGRGSESRESALPDADALVTGEPGVMLTAFYADCVPLWFYDPVREVVALAHAGWRGTALAIGRRTVEAMERKFGCFPSDVLAAIGPSIGACCYEVDQKVVDAMTALGLSYDEDSPGWTDTGGGRYMLNLQEINRQILRKAGISSENIEISKRCTSCSTSLLYSHRKENGRTGRMAAWIGLTRGGAEANDA